jgi:hypothetical protein
MPRGDRTGPMGWGPMTGRGAGFCAGFGVPGFMNRMGGGGAWGRGAWGAGGHGWRHWYYATGLPGWMRAGWGVPAWGTPGHPYAAPVPPGGAREAHLAEMKAQAAALQQSLEGLRQHIQEMEGETKTE